MKVISEKTGISVSLLITLAGGIYWLTTLYSQNESNAQEIREIKREMRELREIKSDVTIIKSDLKRILKKMGEE